MRGGIFDDGEFVFHEESAEKGFVAFGQDHDGRLMGLNVGPNLVQERTPAEPGLER